MNTTARSIANRMKKEGFAPFEVSEADDLEDGIVRISDAVHIQVGYGYANVVRETKKGSFYFYDPAKNYNQLIVDVKNAIELDGES